MIHLSYALLLQALPEGLLKRFCCAFVALASLLLEIGHITPMNALHACAPELSNNISAVIHCLQHGREYKMPSLTMEKRHGTYGHFLRYGVGQKESTKPQRSVV